MHRGAVSNGFAVLHQHHLAVLLRDQQVLRAVPVIVHCRHAGGVSNAGRQLAGGPGGAVAVVGEQRRRLRAAVGAELDDVHLPVTVPVHRHRQIARRCVRGLHRALGGRELPGTVVVVDHPAVVVVAAAQVQIHVAIAVEVRPRHGRRRGGIRGVGHKHVRQVLTDGECAVAVVVDHG